MTDLKPCPSCGEPLDHPSGDGCANMTAHKEKAVGDEELIARLRDDSGDWLTDAAADRIEALIEESGRRLALARSEGVARVEQFERNEALTEQLTAARQDAKEAEAYAEELENEAVLSKAAYEGVSSLLLSVQQDCIKERQRAERLEAKLATCEKYRDAYDEMGRIGTQAVRDLEAKLVKAVEELRHIVDLTEDSDECVANRARATLEEISSEAALNKGESQ